MNSGHRDPFRRNGKSAPALIWRTKCPLFPINRRGITIKATTFPLLKKKYFESSSRSINALVLLAFNQQQVYLFGLFKSKFFSCQRQRFKTLSRHACYPLTIPNCPQWLKVHHCNQCTLSSISFNSSSGFDFKLQTLNEEVMRTILHS
jgi:hypothetical protein